MKKRQLRQDGGHIENDKGKIIVDSPTTVFTQDTLMGKIEYIQNDGAGENQYIPQITYWDIWFAGSSRKMMEDATRNLVSMSRFRSDSVVRLRIHDDTQVNIEGYITHNGHVNFGVGYGKISLKNDIVRLDADSIDGYGLFKELELDIPEGADVINGGGFRVNTLLELKRGTLRNNDSNNFVMSMEPDSLGNKLIPKIKRHPEGHIQYEPNYESQYNVHYTGNDSMLTEAEIPIPIDKDVLADLIVENAGGLHLDREVTANRDIDVASYINTELDYTDNSHTLTLTSDRDPIYRNPNSEIWGNFRRTQLRYDGQRVLYNNDYTYVLFNTPEDAAGITEMTLRVRPKKFPPNAEPETKVERDIFISARDTDGNPVVTGINLELGYGWRHIIAEPARHETNNLPVPEIILQRWDITIWRDFKTSEVPPQPNADGWGWSRATSIRDLGQFAIGISDIGQLVLRSMILMEGPYRYGSMSNDLRMQNLVPDTPPDMYPYNLDPNRDSNFAATIDSHVVDWILVEFYQVDSLENVIAVFYRCALLLDNGNIVESDGSSPVSIARGGMEEGDYFIGIKHRNHHAIFSKNTIAIFPGPDESVYDMRRADNLLFGGSEAKLIDFDPQNSLLFGMRAGEVDAKATGENIITDLTGSYAQRDDIMIWEKRDTEGYGLFDATLSGIVTTRDLNYSWNNRGKVELNR
ncbi:hypothetical protein ACFLSQ_01515 [Bacteroidota bacterium]